MYVSWFSKKRTKLEHTILSIPLGPRDYCASHSQLQLRFISNRLNDFLSLQMTYRSYGIGNSCFDYQRISGELLINNSNSTCKKRHVLPLAAMILEVLTAIGFSLSYIALDIDQYTFCFPPVYVSFLFPPSMTNNQWKAAKIYLENTPIVPPTLRDGSHSIRYARGWMIDRRNRV